MKTKPSDNPFYCKPDNPNYLHRSLRHDYNRPAHYMITLFKNTEIPRFCNITADNDNNPCIQLTKTAEFIVSALQQLPTRYPQIEITGYIIMPDHIHLCIYVKDYLPSGLSRAIASLKGIASSLRYNALPDKFRTEGIQPIFSKGYNDRIAYTPDQWQRQLAYIHDNPRRYVIKRDCPDFLLKRRIITIDHTDYMTTGNIFLLQMPHLFVVKYRRAFTPEEEIKYLQQGKYLINNGSIPISPYIHPKEKEIREYAVENGHSYIRICENGFLQRQYSQGKEFQLIAAGRLLLISPVEHESQRKDMKYSYASHLNQLSARIANLCNSNIPIPIRPL